MIAVIQRVSNANVVVDKQLISSINNGMVIFIGIAHEDNNTDLQWITKKIVGLRIFGDSEGKINNDINHIEGEILLISQFTLLASTKKGNRPSFLNAAKPEIARIMYLDLANALNKEVKKEVKLGVFGADMKVSLTNDGPVTILLDSKNPF